LALLASFSPDRMGVARFVAPISPSEMLLRRGHSWPNCTSVDLAPVPKLGVWVGKMPLQTPNVNLWKTREVS
jgi:hypothetical protein